MVSVGKTSLRPHPKGKPCPEEHLLPRGLGPRDWRPGRPGADALSALSRPQGQPPESRKYWVPNEWEQPLGDPPSSPAKSPEEKTLCNAPDRMFKTTE